MLSPRILVVEDEPLIRMVAVDTLRDAGFQVEEAASAAEAMAKVHDGGWRFDAAIIDIGLPDRPGDKLVLEIRATWPDLPIVIASGHDRAQFIGRFTSDSQLRVVSKPYNNEALSDALAALGIKTSFRHPD
ncbi:response regulator [Limobrevibacterium gyesilva]|uniref:Response regulator n=1 Tax=Limobrevibacterium gyesilva TaxID=2991712 RepID=A0AA41YMS2_9PROT|nr:response regulator [Limobrevibacterium gyesilva]MCW3474883.1 response regulator [Limobrevibacterium gyesilva]